MPALLPQQWANVSAAWRVGSKPSGRKPAAAAKKAAAAQGQPKGGKGPEGTEEEAEKAPDNRSWIQVSLLHTSCMPALQRKCQGHSTRSSCQEEDHVGSDRECHDVQKNWIFIIPAVLMVSSITLLAITGL